jgi:sugar/nucleoside kinase (ribokinase family)
VSVKDFPAASGAARILVIGDMMTDVLVKPEGPILRGSDRRAVIQTMYGGSGANQAIWLGHFGVPVTFAGKVGRADLELCQRHVRRYGVTPALSADDEAPSGTLISIIDPDGERSFLTSRGANDRLDPADLPATLLDGLALLQISGYSLVSERTRASVLSFAAQAKSNGVLISFDPASASFLQEMGPSNFLDWTRGADFCFPNDAEAEALTGVADHDEQCHRLSQFYARTVIKRGGQGAEIVWDGRRLCEAAPAAEHQAVDTTGAGDAFLAGFLANFLATGSLPQSLKAAVAAGTEATQTIGGQPSRHGPRILAE